MTKGATFSENYNTDTIVSGAKEGHRESSSSLGDAV